MIRRLGRRVALGLLMLASGGVAHAAPWPTYNPDPGAHAIIKFETTFTGNVDGGSVLRPVKMEGSITLTWEAFQNGFDLRFENGQAFLLPDGTVSEPPSIDQTNGLLDIRVEFSRLDWPSHYFTNHVDLAYLRSGRGGVQETPQTKFFSLNGSAASGMTGSFAFDDDTYGSNRKLFGTRIQFLADNSFSGDFISVSGIDVCYSPSPHCLFTGQTTVAVPAPAGLAFLALGWAGLSIVQRRREHT
ncbi:hypothetical protein [Sabulicella glaciei]|uniref:PEP-CTERM sorting domain-containing protein n=1 Tax=Sabulicella glaciei TaxID=2984948 RepID=A0ABT3NYS4_9PROT|nr:hypothetical protein [Roseococcus sp. MDT2-1-1]MCW8087318.1 hypothetical protein [Roseococcus sp. MDT2-1-1]